MKTLLALLLFAGTSFAITPGARIVVCPSTTGTNTYACTPSPAETAYVTGSNYLYAINFSIANTGASTINISGLGAVGVQKLTSSGLTALVSGDIQPGIYLARYTGSVMQFVSPVANTSGGTLAFSSITPGVNANAGSYLMGASTSLGTTGGGTIAATSVPLAGVTGVTYSGNTTELATVSGALTSGNCGKFDASGNVIDAGVTCGSGSGVTLTTAGVSGDYIPSGSGFTGNSLALTSSLVPVVAMFSSPYSSRTITNVALWVSTTVSGGSCIIGFYNASTGSLVGNQSGSFSVASAGAVKATFSPSITLPGGTYYKAIMCSFTPGTVGIASDDPGFNNQATNVAGVITNHTSGYLATQGSFNLPSTIGTINTFNSFYSAAMFGAP